MSRPIIEARGVSKVYRLGTVGATSLREELSRAWERRRHHRPLSERSGDFWALRDVSFDVQPGEVVGIVGPNGAGKSTLLKILSRITRQTAGEITLRGRVASLLEVGTGFHPELTGRENVFLNGAILGMSQTEIRRKFDEIVSFAEVEQFLDTPVKRYSSGMYVRLAFAVAAHLEPEILLVDEVLAVGDAAFQRKCLGRMGTVAREGRTVLFVSHNMAAIGALCSRAFLLTSGSIRRVGPPRDVVQTYLETQQARSYASPLRDRRDREGDGSVRTVALRFGTVAQPDCGFWVTGQDSFAEVSFECERNTTYRNVEIALGIKKLDDTGLMYLGTKVVRQDLELISGPGRSTCLINRLPMEPGRYSVTVEIKQNNVIVDRVQFASHIDVGEGDFYGTGVIWPYGGLLCDYSWSHCLERN